MRIESDQKAVDERFAHSIAPFRDNRPCSLMSILPPERRLSKNAETKFCVIVTACREQLPEKIPLLCFIP